MDTPLSPEIDKHRKRSTRPGCASRQIQHLTIGAILPNAHMSVGMSPSGCHQTKDFSFEWTDGSQIVTATNQSLISYKPSPIGRSHKSDKEATVPTPIRPWPRRVAVVQRTVSSAGTYFPVASEIVVHVRHHPSRPKCHKLTPRSAGRCSQTLAPPKPTHTHYEPRSPTTRERGLLVYNSCIIRVFSTCLEAISQNREP